MAIGDDFSIDNLKNIRHVSGATNYTVLEMHRWLGDLADDPEATDTDILDITVLTPSERSTDLIIELINGFNMDDDAIKYLYDGSILQNSGDSDEVLYAGLEIVGNLFDSDTQLQVIQDGALYDGDAPFWGIDYNADAANNILARFLVKVTEWGIDLDSKKILVTARQRSSTFAEFSVTMGLGVSVAAIFANEDINDTTEDSDVADLTGMAVVEGYQLVDLNNGAGTRPYYQKWDKAANSINDLVEWAKWTTRQGTAQTLHGIDGELFRGVTHEIDYDSETSGPFVENELIGWGATFDYLGLSDSDSPFTLGEYLEFSVSGARGRLVGYTQGAGLAGSMVIMVDAGTVVDSDAITGITSGATATIDGAPVLPSNGGGYGILLALDDQGTTGTLWLQLVAGSAPADLQTLYGDTSGCEAFVAGAPTPRTLSPSFIGVSTGTAIIGGYGIVLDPGATDADKFFDLTNAPQQPPNNVTFDVEGLDSDDDYVLVGPKAGGDDFLYTQLTLDSDLIGGAETLVKITEFGEDSDIPTDTAATGTLRITLDDGRHRRVPFTSWDSDGFVIGSTDFTGINAASEGNGVMISYIDVLADAATESFTVVYSGTDRSLWVRVRDGASTPIKTYESPATLGTAGGGVTASRITDA